MTIGNLPASPVILATSMLCLRLEYRPIILSTLAQRPDPCLNRTIVDQIVVIIIRLFGPNYFMQLIDLMADSTIPYCTAHFEARNGLLNLFKLIGGS